MSEFCSTGVKFLGEKSVISLGVYHSIVKGIIEGQSQSRSFQMLKKVPEEFLIRRQEEKAD